MSPRERPILGEAPALERALPWISLAEAPTPVAPCSAIEPWLGRGGVWMKRDDLVSPVFGGNKVRRYEYLLAEAKARGAREIVTVGGLGSTQVMATALLGRELGFDVTAVLFDQPVTAFVREALRTDLAAGARIIWGGGYLGTAWRALRALLGGGRARERYLIMPGASGPVANLGYVDAMLELAEQVRRGELPRPDVLVTPAGSGGTLAGLAIGARLLGWPTRLVGVRIADLLATNRATVRLAVARTARLLARLAPRLASKDLGAAPFTLDHAEVGRGYGWPTTAALDAMPEVGRLLGVPGEITYTGKALAAVRRIAREEPRATILLWNTLSSAPRPAAESAGNVPDGFARVFEGAVPC